MAKRASWELGIGSAVVGLAAMLVALPALAQTKAGMQFTAPAQLDPKAAAVAAEPYKAGDLKGTEATGGGRTQVRQLYGFETDADGKPLQGFELDGKPVAELMKSADSLDLVYVQDKGVTEGKWCGRVTVPAGAGWGTFELRGESIKNWGGFDYFAIDVFTDDTQPIELHFELWDKDTNSYATRFSQSQATHPGKQTFLFPINRAKHNGKEGRTWDECEAKDKINMNGLTKVKIFVPGRKDARLQFWIDSLRLMQEDAAKPKMTVALPASAIAFDFCSAGAVVPGFKAVTAKSKYSDEAGFGFAATDGLFEGGKGWPDLLAGTFISTFDPADKASAPGKQFQFKAKVPAGKYRAWLCAGPVLQSDLAGQEFLLQVNDKALFQDKPDFKAYDSEKYLYRFLWTQYSERPHAQWLDYVDRMYPVQQISVDAADGMVTVTAKNYFVSGLVLVPEADSADYDRMAAKLQAKRIEAFEATMFIPEVKKPQPAAGEDYCLYVPDSGRPVRSASGPTDAERKQTKLATVAAPNQNVLFRVAVTPYKDLGECELKLADLTSSDGGKIAAASILGHFVNYARLGRGVGEKALLPTLAFRGEPGITQALWLWLVVPADAKPGKYAGTFTFQAAASKPTPLPVEIEIVNAKLEPVLPVSFGMYYGGRGNPRPPKEMYWDVIKAQLQWMRKVGFTAFALMADEGGTGPKLLKELGFGQHPAQMQMTSQLGLARQTGRQMGAKVDQDPGSEFKVAGFKDAYMKKLADHKKALDAIGLPYACEIVDEPREVPNPWNRNFADTCRYGDWMSEAGFKTRFVTPMGDNGGAYVGLVDHSDIISIHAGKGSEGLMDATLAKGKTLWYYNTGKDRFTWGIYPWATGATGRWEWHWCWSEGEAAGGYPGQDWYNPFTRSDGMASNAPVGTYPGGFVYNSAFLTLCDGITDYAYLYSLEQAVKKAKAANAKADAVAKAEALLKEMKAKTPKFPGGEAQATVNEQLDPWRTQMARLLAELQ